MYDLAESTKCNHEILPLVFSCPLGQHSCVHTLEIRQKVNSISGPMHVKMSPAILYFILSITPLLLAII